MLIDHLINDRSYGGRFKSKNGFKYVIDKSGIAPKVWDVLYDAYPEVDLKAPKKAFQERTAPAAVPVCLKCKTSDDHLAWPYMGDPSPKTSDISRAGNPAYNAVKYLRNALPCIHCRDPHAAKPRIVRDALIDALTAQTDTLWHEAAPERRISRFTAIKTASDSADMRGRLQSSASMTHYFSAVSAMLSTTAVSTLTMRSLNGASRL